MGVGSRGGGTWDVHTCVNTYRVYEKCGYYKKCLMITLAEEIDFVGA